LYERVLRSVILSTTGRYDESGPLEPIHRFSQENLLNGPVGSQAEWKLHKVLPDAATRIRSPIPVGTKLGVGLLDRLDGDEVGRGGRGFEPSTFEQWRDDADGFGEPFRNALIMGRAPRR
jgi:hypothetical protein